MNSNRREFIKKSSLVALGAGILGPATSFAQENKMEVSPKGINPWIELSESAYLHNAEQVSKMANGKPVLAVIKNNAYGLGDVEVGLILDKSPKIGGLALVKEQRALALRKNGVKKPILLMGDFDDNLGTDLAKSEITLSIHSDESLKKISQLAKRTKQAIKVALYIDTGLGRMGMPYHQAGRWANKIAANKLLHISETFTTLTTPQDFAKEQLKRFDQLIKKMQKAGINPGKLHAAPSYSILDLPSSHLDMVRPGILIHGSFPGVEFPNAKNYSLQPTYRLKAKVIRVEQLRKGDSVGFSRFYTAPQDEWIATIPIGWADGYDSGAENGAKVLVGKQLYRVINVNGSHCNLLLGKKPVLKVGDVATLIGPDHPEITPEGFAKSIKGHNYLQINYKESIPKYVQDTF